MLYICATPGSPPLYQISMPTEGACEALARRLRADQGDRNMPDPPPGVMACRPQGASREAGACQPGGEWGGP